jgi:8-oxo-dGTP pyrophosphatase MutT (NUDIX family)
MAIAEVALLAIPSSPLFPPEPAAMANIENFARPALPAFNITFADSLRRFNMPAVEWMELNNRHWDGLAVGAMVFDTQGRILLIQRAHHDSMPDKWETPGGAADLEDPTLFYSTARELFEEAGLVLTRVKHNVTTGPGQPVEECVFTNSKGTRVFCRFSFEVEVETIEDVVLDPNEHQDFVWATEEEVRTERIGDRSIPITNHQMQALVLEAFRLRNSAAETGEA